MRQDASLWRLRIRLRSVCLTQPCQLCFLVVDKASRVEPIDCSKAAVALSVPNACARSSSVLPEWRRRATRVERSYTWRRLLDYQERMCMNTKNTMQNMPRKVPWDIHEKSGKHVDVRPVNLRTHTTIVHALRFSRHFLRVRHWNLWIVCGNGDSGHNIGMEILTWVTHVSDWLVGSVVTKLAPFHSFTHDVIAPPKPSFESNHRQKLCRISLPSFVPWYGHGTSFVSLQGV